MENTSENKKIEDPEKNVCIGLLAHVDAGKTTLAEAMLNLSGVTRKLGRVDHGDAFLDTYALEKERGITIFAKQARLKIGVKQVTLLDTPGHADFSAEMERTLKVLDYGIVVINASEGIQSHVDTLWRLLEYYRVPAFIFVNKMDLPGCSRENLFRELKEHLDGRCVDFTDSRSENKEFLENVAVCSEDLMEKYLDGEKLSDGDIASAVLERKIFPCFFGSALHLNGVEEFLKGLDSYLLCREKYGDEFGARVYKISRDESGNRLTHLRLTGGKLHTKDVIAGEKVEQIRLYSGSRYELRDEVGGGCVCAVTGPDETYCGQGLGCEEEGEAALLEPVMTYRIILPQGSDAHTVFAQLKTLEEEIPELHMVWINSEIHVQIMGEVQTQILTGLIKERFGLDVGFGAGSVIYRETITEPVIGIGHFEPLRHYAEVQLLMEPGERGSGLQFESRVSDDDLPVNYQHLVMTHLEECDHPGVLTGSPVTDMRISLIAGRAHQAHTQGGDFRQATYRAVRQGLRKAHCILLEPMYDFKLALPADQLGRAMSDITGMSGRFDPPDAEGESAVLTGRAPVSEMQGYQMEVISYTGGKGTLTCTFGGYEPCHNAGDVIESIGYDPDADTEHPTGSVFCAHGAGFEVKWDQVDSYAHLDTAGKWEQKNSDKRMSGPEDLSMDDELEEIFCRTYGDRYRDRNLFRSPEKKRTMWNGKEKTPDRNESTVERETTLYGGKKKTERDRGSEKEYLLVDGYNVIFSWDELRDLSKVNLESARDLLMDIMSNYKGYIDATLILVYDAYKVKGNPGKIFKYHNIYVVYTREAQLADQYIEKTVHEIGGKYHVTVATSDALEQSIIWGEGAYRISSREFKTEVERVCNESLAQWRANFPTEKNRPFGELLS